MPGLRTCRALANASPILILWCLTYRKLKRGTRNVEAGALLGGIRYLGHVELRSFTIFLFRPGLLFLWPFQSLLPRIDSGWVWNIPVLLSNAAFFGTVAYVWRFALPLFVVVLLTLNYIALPPSDAKLQDRFAHDKPDLDRLVLLSQRAPSTVGIGYDELQDENQKILRFGDPNSPISRETWNEYRFLLKRLGINDRIYLRSGEVAPTRQTPFRKITHIGTLYGYVYCPRGASPPARAFLACEDGRDEYDLGDYRHKRIAPDWFLVEAFSPPN